MRAKEVSVADFFAGGVKYVSPSFQRSYGWRRERCARLLEGMKQPPERGCFLGAIVVMALETAPDGCRKLLMVDGTHRLMSLLALLLAIRDEAAETDPALAARIQSGYFVHTHEDGHTSFKCIVPKKDRAVFEALVMGRKPASPSSAFMRAYRFGRDAAAGTSAAELARWTETLPRHFSLVALTLERDEDPYPIFKLLSPPDEDFTRMGLKAYTLFSPDPELMALIAGGESREVEFKERTFRCGKSPSSPMCGPEGTHAILRSVAGFMNSPGGGTLLIGIRDDGEVRGVEDEYAHADKGKSNWDGYQLFLCNMFRARLSTQNPFLYYLIERRSAQNHAVCMVRVKPAAAPVYLDKRLFVRTGNQTVEMLGPDLVNYVSARWPTEK